MHKFVIYKDVPVIIERKMMHVRKIGGRIYGSFCKDYGDIPVVVFNEETKQFEPVLNSRGKGYAGRNRKMHRNAKRKSIKHKGKWQ